MAMRFPKLGLRTKIILLISVSVITVVIASTFFAMLLTRQLVEEEIYRRALGQARATAQQFNYPDALGDSSRVEQILRQMKHDFPSVRQADVFLHQPDHHLVASTNPDRQHLELDNLPEVEKYLEFEQLEGGQMTIETPGNRNWIMSTEVLAQGKTIGCLDVTVSKSPISVVTRDLVIRNLALMVASLVVVMLVVQLFFVRGVQRPIREMINIMQTVEGGKLDVRARVKSRDEIGLLAAHLNRMLVRIQIFNSELGRKVTQATSELERSNEELRRINEELFETQKILARSERLAAAGQLAASLAHEIGTPLNSISGHVQLLARRKTWDSASERRLQIIDQQIENIVRTVKQLLSWTRKFELKIDQFDLRRLLEDVILLSSPHLTSRKIKVRKSLPTILPRIYGDAGYLQQVFLNLINNSMDAMPKGGELRISASVPSSPEGEVELVFEDTGGGIALETLDHIFEPMFTTKRLGTGAGLGLALCDQIIRQHGGTIQASSQVGQGARFALHLPIDCRASLDVAAAGTAVNISSIS
jgi:two-component system, NtrC family, sensor kinase